MDDAHNQSSNSLLKRLLSALCRDQRGGSAVLIGFALPLIISGLGIGLDAGMCYLEKRKLQLMADTAGLGAVRALHDGATFETAKTVALNDARRNGYFTSSLTTITVNSLPSATAHVGQSNAVEVVISKKVPLFFTAYFLSSTTTVSARSVAYRANARGWNARVSMASPSMGQDREILPTRPVARTRPSHQI